MPQASLGSRQIERHKIARDSVGDLYAMLKSSKMKKHFENLRPDELSFSPLALGVLPAYRASWCPLSSSLEAHRARGPPESEAPTHGLPPSSSRAYHAVQLSFSNSYYRGARPRANTHVGTAGTMRDLSKASTCVSLSSTKSLFPALQLFEGRFHFPTPPHAFLAFGFSALRLPSA